MGKYLNFYNKSMSSMSFKEVRRFGNTGGLCSYFKKMEIFTPTDSDCDEYNVRAWGFFGSDKGYGYELGFGPTRQNFVLFLAAMNNEL